MLLLNQDFALIVGSYFNIYSAVTGSQDHEKFFYTESWSNVLIKADTKTLRKTKDNIHKEMSCNVFKATSLTAIL